MLFYRDRPAAGPVVAFILAVLLTIAWSSTGHAAGGGSDKRGKGLSLPSLEIPSLYLKISRFERRYIQVDGRDAFAIAVESAESSEANDALEGFEGETRSLATAERADEIQRRVNALAKKRFEAVDDEIRYSITGSSTLTYSFSRTPEPTPILTVLPDDLKVLGIPTSDKLNARLRNRAKQIGEELDHALQRGITERTPEIRVERLQAFVVRTALSIGAAAVILVAGNALHRSIVRRIDRCGSEDDGRKSLLKSWRSAVEVLQWLLVTGIGLSIFLDALYAFPETRAGRGVLIGFFASISWVVGGLAAAVVLSRLVGVALAWYETYLINRRRRPGRKGRRIGTIFPLVRQSLTALFVLFGLFGGTLVGFNMVAASALAGLIAAIVWVKFPLGDIGGAFRVLFLDPFARGDVLKVGNRLMIVEEVNLLDTVLRTGELGETIIVRNSRLGRVVNLSRRGRICADRKYPIRYGENTARARQVLQERVVAPLNARWAEQLRRPGRVHNGIQGHGPSGPLLRVEFWLDAEAENYEEVYFSFLRELDDTALSALADGGFDLPYAGVENHLFIRSEDGRSRRFDRL